MWLKVDLTQSMIFLRKHWGESEKYVFSAIWCGKKFCKDNLSKFLPIYFSPKNIFFPHMLSQMEK